MKNFDTIKAIRKIRDDEYKKTKKLSRSELLDYYHVEGVKALTAFGYKPKNQRRLAA